MPVRPSAGAGQDWAPADVGRGSTMRSSMPTTGSELAAAKASGAVVTEKRFGAGSNQRNSVAIMSARKLEEADDVGTIQRVDKELSKAIMQARMAKKMTQKDLATAINAKPQLVAEYENGKAIPDGSVIAKLERQLGTKLPRPGKKSSVPKKEGPGAKTGAPSAAKVQAVTRGGPPKRR